MLQDIHPRKGDLVPEEHLEEVAATMIFDNGKSTKIEKKFKLITGKGVKGPRRGGGGRGGFLFSTEGPPGSSKNPTRSRSRSESVKSGSSTRTIVIPRANRELLRELTLSLSELRAGNEGEREMCVQLSREARRRGILPRHLLSKEEMLWSSYK